MPPSAKRVIELAGKVGRRRGLVRTIPQARRSDENALEREWVRGGYVHLTTSTLKWVGSHQDNGFTPWFASEEREGKEKRVEEPPVPGVEEGKCEAPRSGHPTANVQSIHL